MPAEATQRAAYRKEVAEPTAAIAQTLQHDLGQRLVAYVTDTQSPKAVGRWAHGVEPRDDARRKLRELYRTVLILKEVYGADTIRAWLEGANPDLNNQAPVEMLRAGRASPRVFEAAESFIH